MNDVVLELAEEFDYDIIVRGIRRSMDITGSKSLDGITVWDWEIDDAAELIIITKFSIDKIA